MSGKANGYIVMTKERVIKWKERELNGRVNDQESIG